MLDTDAIIITAMIVGPALPMLFLWAYLAR